MEDHILQVKKGPPQKVLASFYPEEVIFKSILSKYIEKIEYQEAAK